MTLSLSLCLGLLFACGSNNKTPASETGGDTASTHENHASGVIGPDGGTLSLANGASLTVPAGALDAEVELSLAYKADLSSLGVAELPEVFEGTGDGALVLTPHGTAFLEAVTATMPFSDRHWAVRVWDNVELAKSSGNTMWVHPRALVSGAVDEVQLQVEAGMWSSLTTEMFEGVVETPVNEGAKDFLDLGPHNSLYVYAELREGSGTS